MAYQSFSAALKGGSHTKHGKELQDCSAGGKYKDLYFAVVADGHGAEECFRSALGAEMAVKCAVQSMYEFTLAMAPRFEPGFFKKPTLPEQEEFDKLVKSNIQHIIANWHNEVEKHFGGNPFTGEELEKAGDKYRDDYSKGGYYKAYGTTLIACAITKEYWFALHIGDGRFTALSRQGVFDQPVPWDEKCFLNQTTSICDDDAAQRARFYVSLNTKKNPPPAAVFLCSDGVDDNYPVEKNEEHLYKLYREITRTFAEEGFESTCKQIRDLAEGFATKGKGDDTSIALIIDMEAVKEIAALWRKHPESEKADQGNGW